MGAVENYKAYIAEKKKRNKWAKGCLEKLVEAYNKGKLNQHLAGLKTLYYCYEIYPNIQSGFICLYIKYSGKFTSSSLGYINIDTVNNEITTEVYE